MAGEGADGTEGAAAVHLDLEVGIAGVAAEEDTGPGAEAAGASAERQSGPHMHEACPEAEAVGPIDGVRSHH